MTPFSGIWHEMGKVGPVSFGAKARITGLKVTWNTAPPNPATVANVRVIVTPNDNRLPPSATTGHTAAPAVVVEQLDASGFFISAYNVDGVAGEAGFDYLAVAENPRTPSPTPEVRFGISQPKALGKDGTLGDWSARHHHYSTPFSSGDLRVRLLTAHNFGETGLRSLYYHTDAQSDSGFGTTVQRQDFTIAAVGITSERFNPNPLIGMAYVARSGDAAVGKVGFNWMTLVPAGPVAKTAGEAPPSNALNWRIDSNIVFPIWIKPHPNQDEWQYRDIRFSRPFNETPAVFLTGFAEPSLNAKNLPGFPPAVIGTVFNATRFGFTLGARNVDFRDGQTGFFWVAISCAEGCG